MRKYLIIIITTFLLSNVLFSQDLGINPDTLSTKKTTPPENLFSPTIGLGVGNFKFYGDILDADRKTPFISNIAYDLHIKQRLNPFLTAKFYVLFGRVSANEHSQDRNLNFESKLTTGGIALMYDFGNFLPEKRSISPFISLGVESVEFLSKTDLFDEFGNKYNYWSDGSIRNLPQDDPNAANAIVIQRDYVYETDIRESNFDGKGKFPERSFAIPVGAGVIMHATKHIDFTLGFTMHYTFTDLIDGVEKNSGGERIGNQPGNGGNDKFLMSSLAISYNFQNHDKDEVIKEFEPAIDYLAYDMGDEDGDGVIDFIDECAWTPSGVEVDEKGCPLDKDKDFVANYKDDELETRENAFVSPNGVELTDEMIEEAYLHYMDTSGVFAEVENRTITVGEKSKVVPRNYKVQVGEFTEAIDATLVDKFLGIPDVEISSYKDSLTVVTAGDYKNLPDAVQRKVQLTKEGFDAAIVVQEDENEKGRYVSVGDEANNMDVSEANTSENVVNSQGLIFRVQLGAFSKQLPKGSFNNLNDIIELKADDGLYKYLYPSAYNSVEEAAKQKINLALTYGVKDAFIVAYKDGKRITLKEAGVITTANESDIKTQTKNYDKSNISYKVQIGAYKNQLPTEILTKFMSLKGVEQTEIDNELTRYSVGNFKTYAEVEAFKNEIVAKGIAGAFVIAFHKDELIPVNKAKELTGE